MLKMKWITDYDGRLVATWVQSGEASSPGCRAATIMLKMKWTMRHEGRLTRIPAQSREQASMGCHLSLVASEGGRNDDGIPALHSPSRDFNRSGR
jgi:hypothetical protein